MPALESADELAERIAEHFELAQFDESEHVCVIRSTDSEQSLAELLAEDIVVWRVGRRHELAESWRTRRDGTANEESLRPVLKALVEPATGTPEAPRSPDHIEAMVAEHLWFALSRSGIDDLPVVHVWGPSFDVTDAGGDGLVVHASEGVLSYRLWEVKKYTGAGVITKTGLAAIRQLRREALKYLARFKQLGEHLPDEDLAQLHSQLLDSWLAAEDFASAGASVASSTQAVQTECFGRLPISFPALASPVRLRGQVNATLDFSTLSRLAIEEIWKGL